MQELEQMPLDASKSFESFDVTRLWKQLPFEFNHLNEFLFDRKVKVRFLTTQNCY